MAMITTKRFIVCMSILLAVCIACMFWIYFSQHTKINHLQAERNILENYRLNAPFLKAKITILENENAILQLDNEYYKNHYIANKLYINKLELDYLQCEIYANTAELILRNNNIYFARIDD